MMADSFQLEDLKHDKTRSEESNRPSSDTATRSPLDLIDDAEVANLVRIVSSRQRTQSVNTTRGEQTTGKNSALNHLYCDPTAPDFDLRKWLLSTLQILDQEGIQMQSLGVVFKDLNVSGSGSALQLQKTLATTFTNLVRPRDVFMRKHGPSRRILRDFNGLLKPGEMLLVLGRPGAGCSTMLKTICGETHGLTLENKGAINFNGISQSQMIKEFKGEIIHNQEVEKHFPNLTVGQTLEFAAATRTPSNRPAGLTRNDFVKLSTQIVMAIFGLTHTYNTKVGNDYIRGVSGGERKRVSIAEMALAGAPVGAWDNSTRGLDSATALKFVQFLRLFSDLMGSTQLVAAYQASQSIYDLFDKVTVLYEGRQIFYGPASAARAYFERQGWECPPRQTTGDFLTSVTNPQERRARAGMEQIVPRTADDFESYWRQSREYIQLQADISAYETVYPMIDSDGGSGEALTALQQWKQGAQAKHTRPVSSFRISVPMQIRLNIKRSYQRIWNDLSATISNLGGQVIMALVISSVFYDASDDTSGIATRCATLFFAVLLNALTAMNEINSLYSQRPIVEKHASYAFYHPFTEAIAGVVSDIPLKFAMAVVFNMILYFMTNLRREANHFFLYFLVTFVTTLTMSGVFRTLAAVTKTVSQAMTLAGVMVLSLVIYTGFVIPVPSMHPWFEWIHYLNPIYYSFEIVMANEFHNREFPCSSFIPSYTNFTGDTFVCSTASSVAGELTVNGDLYIWENYKYSWDHVWRNFGIIMAFLVASLVIYVTATELNSSANSTAEVLVFRRGHEPDYMRENKTASSDEENPNTTDVRPIRQTTVQDDDSDMAMIVPQTDIFTWRDVCYDIEIKGEPRRLLDHVSGWVKPGTLTALMGVSGAGKTTLLDVLAHRTTMGVITGDMFVNGRDLDASFQRKTGYVQQQDLHLATATVRESLRFSAILRQPASVSIAEKYQYVEEVIKMLKMEDFAEAVVGVPGEGLNVEQRKLLTIGVELAAKPKLLLFLDEPTSGLDSQSSWAICTFLRQLASMGQAVLCTIHQPSAILFQQFDQLLFLARGGKSVYYGPIGENSCTMLEYFERNGGRKCDESENPAEYMLDVVNLGTNASGQDWFDVWKQSKEFAAVQEEIDRIHQERSVVVTQNVDSQSEDAKQTSEFAMPFWFQLYQVTYRVFQQYWRMPDYIIAKWGLGTVSGLFIGFSFFHAKTSMQGMETVLYSLFMLCTIFSSIVQQIMPLFITQRSLYEVRERPSKAYSWKAFLIANIIVEIPYQIIMALLVFACYYFPTVGIQTSAQQGLVLLLCIEFFVYGGTFAQMVIAALPDTETASAVVLLLFAMSLTFCGVMQAPSALPKFWIFMYRVSPFTYWIGGMASTQLHGREVVCSSSETSIFNPPINQTCQQYMAEYLDLAGGQLQNPNATSDCRYCSLTIADEYLAGSDIYFDQRWRNFGLIWVYIVFNIFIATSTYYLFRVRKWNLDGFKGFAKSKKQ